MGKTNFSKAMFALMLVLLLALTACSGKPTSDPAPGKDPVKEEEPGKGGEEEETPGRQPGEPDENGLYDITEFSKFTSNEGTTIDGGTFYYGLVSDTPFEGTLNAIYYAGAPDAEVMQFFDESMLTWDANYVYTNDGAATYEVSEDGKTFTFTIRDNVNWSDGTPVTAEDWEYAHEVIADPDYTEVGVRFDSTLRNVVGIEDFHEGKADKISGIKVLNDKQLEITYIEATPSLITGGIWTSVLPKHIFKDIPILEQPESDAVRVNPVGFGPFKVDSIVPGESVVYVKNEDYWRGEPKLDKVILKVVNPTVVTQALEKGEVDAVSDFPTDQFPDVDIPNVTWLGDIDRAYSYIGFKLGAWDKEQEKVVMDPTKKMADIELRKAMWHAVDNNAVGERFYHGLRWAGTTLIPPSHPEFHDATNPGRPYDPELAKKILDEAGYLDVDGDSIREDKDGNKLVINYASMSGGEVAEPMAQYYIQAWEAVGLKVELLDGRLQEFNSFYDRVGRYGDDDPEIDIYAGAWGVGIDVDPSGLYGQQAIYNFSRFHSEDNDRLLAAGISAEAFDVEFRKKTYNEWQQLMVDEIPAFPTLYRSTLQPVNKRVHNYAVGDGTGVYLYEIAVTQEEPIKKTDVEKE